MDSDPVVLIDQQGSAIAPCVWQWIALVGQRFRVMDGAHTIRSYQGQPHAHSAGMEVSRSMTSASLRSFSQKDLAQMAKCGGVRGWHTMRKDQLVKGILNASRSKPSKSQTSKKTATRLRADRPRPLRLLSGVSPLSRRVNRLALGSSSTWPK